MTLSRFALSSAAAADVVAAAEARATVTCSVDAAAHVPPRNAAQSYSRLPALTDAVGVRRRTNWPTCGKNMSKTCHQCSAVPW